MFGRFHGLRRLAVTGRADGTALSREPRDHESDTPPADDQSSTLSASPVPEQPIVLAPLTPSHGVKVGVVLPARRPGALLPSIAPRVPKRAVFAVGIFAGLAVPALTRQLAERAIVAAFGPGRRSAEPAEQAAIEIIRVTYASRKPGSAAASVDRLLQRLVN